MNRNGHIRFSALVIMTLTSLAACKRRSFNATIKTSEASSMSDATLKALQTFDGQDLALLFPLKRRPEDDARMLGLEGIRQPGQDKGEHAFLSRRAFDEVVKKGYDGFQTQGDAHIYKRLASTFELIRSQETWKVVSARFAPCVRPNPKALNTRCRNEFRLVAQPVLTRGETNGPDGRSGIGTTPTPGEFTNFGTREGDRKSDRLRVFETPRGLGTPDLNRIFWTEDQALHLVYALDTDDTRTLLTALGKLKEATESTLISGPSGNQISLADRWSDATMPGRKILVHPLLYTSLLEPEALSGDGQKSALEAEGQLKAAIAEVARGEGPRQNLDHILFMGTGVRDSGSGWAFSSFHFSVNGAEQQLTQLRLNQTPSDWLKNNLQSDPEKISKASNYQVMVNANHFSNPFGTMPYEVGSRIDTLSPALKRLSSSETRADGATAFWPRAARLMNPFEHSQNSADCVSCHISTSAAVRLTQYNQAKVAVCMAYGIAGRESGCSGGESTLPETKDIISFDSFISGQGRKAPLSDEDYAALKAVERQYERIESWAGFAAMGLYPNMATFNLRQFGYYTGYPSVSLRTQAEAARDALYVRAHAVSLLNGTVAHVP